MKKNEFHLEDELNPEYLFSGVWNDLLLKIANGEINVQKLAREQMALRELDENGSWVGLAKAEDIWKIK